MDYSHDSSTVTRGDFVIDSASVTSNSRNREDRANEPIKLLMPLGDETTRPEEETGTDTSYITYNVHGINFELPPRYASPIEALGRGGYGFVASATMAATGQPVAVKKISNAFRNVMDARRVLREVVIQRHMGHPNIATVRDVIRPPCPSKFQDVYVVYDLMPSDLQQVIQSEQQLTEKHFRHIMVQLLRGLKFIHSSNVLHRDLKPSNILIDERCNIRITDFGLARTVLGMEDHMTEYVVTRWYRAPELLLNCQRHTAAVDIWSIGCIFMELATRHVWIKGRDPLDQLRKTMERVGSPDESDLGFLDTADARRFILLHTPFPRRPFTELCPELSPLGADLAQRMLKFDPEKRITVEEALSHPYLANQYNPVDATVNDFPFELDLSFEQAHYTVPVVKQLIYEVACDFVNSPP